MGNSITKNPCFSGGDTYAMAVDSVPDKIHGHSFRYVPTPSAFHKSTMSSGTTFISLSGAAISANLVTSSSMSSCRLLNELTWPQSSVCTFESSHSFATGPLQATPTRFSMSAPLQSMSDRMSDTSGTTSTISERLLDHSFSSSSSFVSHQAKFSPPVAERGDNSSRRCKPLFQFFTRATSRLKLGAPRYTLLSEGPVEAPNMEHFNDGVHHAPPNDNVQWAQGMVGEDRFHVAVSEEHGWVFVGIYDGFNGPDATDYLVENLYVALCRELKGVLWNDMQCDEATTTVDSLSTLDGGNGSPEFELKPVKSGRMKLPETDDATTSRGSKAMHSKVFKAMARALRKTEEEFFKMAEQRAAESPELGLMGSCVLVMLMKGADVYVMNVGDSRAVLAGRWEPDLENILGKTEQDLQQVQAEIMRELKSRDVHGLECVQLNNDHNTADDTEAKRVRDEHPSDSKSIIDGRVKGKLNVTRAFGAGYLKEPKWNSRLLAAFKIDYIGSDPYINCIPSVCHHQVGPYDKFLVLSSDGIYQYFTNKEVVDHVEMFTVAHPNGDPAQHLIGELLLRAARKAGMDCHELLETPCGDRRKYHDDVSIIVISFKGTIWTSSV